MAGNTKKHTQLACFSSFETLQIQKYVQCTWQQPSFPRLVKTLTNSLNITFVVVVVPSFVYILDQYYWYLIVLVGKIICNISKITKHISKTNSFNSISKKNKNLI